ncbi:MAG: ATP-binding protein [Anaerolineaceae bacterium]|nr:ATP-binding protein [Anaerolineaceae bacterium]
MRTSLKSKMILTYLAVALVTLSVVAVVIAVTSDQSLRNMVVDQQVSNLTSEVQDYYAANGNLNNFFFYYMNYSLIESLQRPQDQSPSARQSDLRGLTGLVDAEFIAILPVRDYPIGQKVAGTLLQDAQPVQYEGKTIAYILVDPSPAFSFNPAEQRFAARTRLAIGLAGAAGLVSAVVIGILLAGNILKPIRKLTAASAELAAGALGQQVTVTSRDELGQLTTTFNKMSADLAHSDQERRRLTADITHDLSTPLQIISGYIEMIEEGDIQLSAENLAIIKTEMEHLRRLVGDLTTLSQAEGGGLEMQMAPTDVNQLLETVIHAYESIAAKQGINLILDTQTEGVVVRLDEGRMSQVLKNLLDNALRYTPEGGRITLGSRVADKVEIFVSDTGSGIEAEDLPYIFDRFYQGDKARTGGKGKMGLGLSICKALTAAQGCELRAESTGQNQGTRMVITLPDSTDSAKPA